MSEPMRERPPTAAEAFDSYRRWLAANLIVTAPHVDNRKKAA